ILALGFAVTSAQTLGDVAKREEARRKQLKTPAKVYTNEDLRGDAGAAAPPRHSREAEGRRKSGGRRSEKDRSVLERPPCEGTRRSGPRQDVRGRVTEAHACSEDRLRGALRSRQM